MRTVRLVFCRAGGVGARHSAVEVAFVADNPGDWMFHCHVLEHQESGMMGVIRVQ